MKDLIEYSQKHMIWQDEIGSTFLLTKHCEIYKYGKDTLRVLSWTNYVPVRMLKMGLISTIDNTDDHLYIFEISVQNLAHIVAFDGFKYKPRKKWLKDKEEKLGHKIRLYNVRHDKNPKAKLLKNLKQRGKDDTRA